jgi:hypothetical protein
VKVADAIVMRLHTRLDRWTALFLATLGCTPLIDCGGRETDNESSGAGGSGGNASDGGVGTAGIGGGGTGGITTGDGGSRPPGPVPGRPFLVDGMPRQASIRMSDEWRGPSLALRTDDLDADQRDRLSRAWTRAAQLEHASIAAFARFTMQLLALGAPASLVEAAAAAIADETAHAQLAFAVASGYAGRTIGPGPLSMEGALGVTSLRDVVIAVIGEGCLGETVSAIQATETLFYVTDPALRNVLMTIVDDETRHAQLAWQFVKWALEQGDEELRHVVRGEFARAAGEIDRASSAPLDARNLELLARGAMPPQLGQRVRAECVQRVILPCAAALLERRNAAGAPRAPEVHA